MRLFVSLEPSAPAVADLAGVLCRLHLTPARLAGTFPTTGRPSVLWVGLAGDLTPLQRLAGEVGVAVRSAGIALPRRPFTPHLTVARYRDAPTGASSAAVAVAALAAYAGPAFSVGELRLMQSRLGVGVRHEAVACWPLSGGSPQ